MGTMKTNHRCYGPKRVFTDSEWKKRNAGQGPRVCKATTSNRDAFEQWEFIKEELCLTRHVEVGCYVDGDAV